jgi:hypothetical protein
VAKIKKHDENLRKGFYLKNTQKSSYFERKKKLEVTIFKQGVLKGLKNKVGFLKFLIVLSDLDPNLAHSCLGQ